MSLAIEKAQAIRLFILDVDGVLTTGAIYYDSDGKEMRGYHMHDGLGIKLLQKHGIHVAVISGKNSESISSRLKDLNITLCYLGKEDKLPSYVDLKQRLQIPDQQIAYMGDDLPDLPLLRRAGLAITVPKAPEIIMQHVDYITKKKAGKGAVREACDFILTAQNHYQSVLQSYLI